jgi:hypothetical protein
LGSGLKDRKFKRHEGILADGERGENDEARMTNGE